MASSSWPIARHDSQLRGRAAIKGPSAPVIRFATPVGAGELSDPVVGEDGTIYVAGRVDNKLYALTPAGGLKWTFTGHIPPPKKEFFMAPPALMRDGTLLISSTDTICTKNKPGEFFYAINPDGTLRWKKELEGGSVFAANVGSNDSIYVVTDFCWLYSLDPRGYLASPDTIVNWRTNLRALPENAPAINLSDLPVVVAADTVMTILRYGSFRFKRNYTPGDTLQGLVVDEAGNIYLTTRDHGRILSVSATGALRWLREPDASFGIPALPALGSDGTLYLTSVRGGWLLALDTATGAERWRRELPGGDFISPVVIDAAGHLYALHSTAGLVCFAADGTLRWSRPEVRGSRGTSPAFGAEGTIYVSGDRMLYAVAQGNTIRLQPSSLDFGQVCLNTEATATFTIENISSDPVVLSAITSDDSALRVTALLPFTLPPGGKDTVAVALLLAQTGTFTANLTVATADGEQVSLPVTAESVAPQILLEAHPSTFGEICPGDTVFANVLIINPSATCTLHVNSYAVSFSKVPNSGQAPELPTGATATAFSLAPGDTFKLIVRTRQNIVGRFEAKVTVWSNAGGPVEITIPGTVLSPQIAGTDTLAFGKVTLAQTDTLAAQVWNAGTCELQISEFLLRGAQAASFALLGATVPRTLSADDTLGLAVTFTPDRLGLHTAQLLIISNAQPDTLVIELRGTGVPPEPDMALVPADSLVLTTCLTDTATADLVIRNQGAAVLRLDGVVIDNPVFALVVSPHFPVEIPGGGEYRLAIHFAGPSVGEYRGLLTVRSNDRRSDSTVVLLGRVDGPAIALSANPPDYGEVCVGTTGTTHVCIKNPSDCPLLVESTEIFAVEGGVTRPLRPELPVAAALRFEIAPHDSFCLSVNFMPGAAGPFKVIVLVTSNAVNADSSIVIPGQAVSPLIAGEQEVNFDSVAVGDSKQKDARVWNADACTVKIDRLRITGTDSSFFAVGPASLPLALLQGDSAAIPVIFSPTNIREYVATLLVYSNAQPNPLPLALRGRGVPRPPVPDVKVEPLALDFGEVFLTNDSTLLVTVTNEGGVALPINRLTLSGDSAFAAPLDTFTLQPNESRALPVTFAPGDTGAFSAQLWIVSSDPDAEEDTVVVPMKGRGVSPVTAPPAVQFEKICLGESARLTVTITNHGSREIAADFLSFVPGRPEFRVEPDNDFRVPAGGSNTVEIAFTPRTVEVVYDTLRIPWRPEAGISPPVTLIAVSGSGWAGQLIAGDSLVVFADTKIGETSGITYVIRNPGTCALRVDSLAVSGAGFALDSSPTVPFVIAAGDSHLLKLEFSPDTTGLQDGVLYIAHNDLPRHPKLVKLQGNGISLVVNFAPNPNDFGEVEVGVSRCESIEVSNQGTVSLVIDSVTTLASPPATFVVENDEFVLNPGERRQIEVCFTPPDTGRFEGRLRLHSRTGEILSGALLGSGTAVRISLLPARLDFGSVALNTTASRSLTISNRGNKTLVINDLKLPAPYRMRQTGVPITIPAVDAREITLEFMPTEVRDYPAELVLYSNARNQREVRVPVTGRGFREQLPRISLCPSDEALDFGRVRVRRDSIRTMELVNCGEVPLEVARPAVASEHFEILEPVEAFIMQPNEVKTVRVRFHPRIAGPKGDELVIQAHEAGNRERSVQADVDLSGEGRPNPNVAVRVTPAIFTPNDDSYNDRVRFDYKDFEVTEPVLHLFNIRGAVVATFQLKDSGEYYWDGRDRESNGKSLPAGIYLWLIEDGGRKLGSGYISLVR
ncbi:MAG: choice-of-anchor D domain-containing protein [candidate division KSB1 bacterium]|nr:choice-of-anchor D domain-containing protein [candidate division KSB1 bacterium]